MHLVYVIDSLAASGGAEQALAAMAPGWVAHGYRLDVVALTDRLGLQGDLLAAGATVTTAPEGSRRQHVRWLTQLLRERRPDLVHTTLFESDVAGRVAAWRSGVPVVTSLVSSSYGPEHRSDPRLSPSRLRAAQLTDLVTATRAVRFHALTRHVAAAMSRRLLIPRRRIDVVPRGRDPRLLGTRTPARRALVRSELDVAQDAVVVLAAARQEYQKGLDVLLAAAATDRTEHGAPVLLVAGREGGASAQLRSQEQSLGLSQRVRWLGVRADVPDLIAAADVVVVPSRWEGLGSVVIEAMGLGTPVVASDVPAVRETLGDERNGFLVPPDDPAALAGALRHALTEEGWVRAGRARQAFAARFALDEVNSQMRRFHAEALKRPPAVPSHR